jgi:hypothetical protein
VDADPHADPGYQKNRIHADLGDLDPQHWLKLRWMVTQIEQMEQMIKVVH